MFLMMTCRNFARCTVLLQCYCTRSCPALIQSWTIIIVPFTDNGLVVTTCSIP